MKKLKILKTIISVLFFGLVLIIGSFVFLSGKKEIYGWRVLVVKSGSMEPTIKTGSLIFIKKQEAYNKEDVVTYGSSVRAEGLTTHRIVEKVEEETGEFFKTKGDFNSVEDAKLVSKGEIVGRYQLGIPYIGYVIGFAQTQTGVVLLVIIPGTVIIYEEIKNIKKSISKFFRKKNKEKVEKKD